MTASPPVPAETPGETPAETLRQAAALVREAAETKSAAPWRQSGMGVSDRDGNYVHDDPELSDGYWIAMLGPQVAEPLAAWLDWEADEQEERTEECVECCGSGEVFDGDPLPFDCTDCVARRPLALARALLGSPVPEPDGEGT